MLKGKEEGKRRRCRRKRKGEERGEMLENVGKGRTRVYTWEKRQKKKRKGKTWARRREHMGEMVNEKRECENVTEPSLIETIREL